MGRLEAARRLRGVTGQQDPWGDVPHWSDEAPAAADEGGPAAAGPARPTAAGPAAMPAAGALPADDPAALPDGTVTCSWCGHPATEDATRCASCGAALAQRESIGDLVIPGLTAVDPALKDLDGRPLHLRGPSPTQGAASGLIVAAAAGGPIGLAIVGGIGALAAAEYLGASGDKAGGKGHGAVGETSGAVLQAIERLERGEALPVASETTPRPELDPRSMPAPPEGSSAQSAHPEAATEEASDGPS